MVLGAFVQMEAQDNDTLLSQIHLRSSALQLERVLLLSKEIKLYQLLQHQQNDGNGLPPSLPDLSFEFHAPASGVLDTCHPVHSQLLRSKLLRLQVLKRHCSRQSCP